MGVAVAAVAATLVGVLDENRMLRREIEKARADVLKAADQIKGLEAEKGDMIVELTGQRDERQRAEDERAETKEAASKTNEIAAPRPVKVRTFLGNQYVGMSWLVPSGVSKDPRTGALTYEPVLILDESLRQNLVTYRTNVVEREVSRATTVNYNYPWIYYYPVGFVIATNKAVRRDPPKTPTTPPPTARQPQDSRPFLSTAVRPPTDNPFLPAMPQAQSVALQNRFSSSGGFQPQSGGMNESARKPPAVWTPARQ